PPSLGRSREGTPVLGDLLHRLDHVWRGVAEDQARVVAVEVEAIDAVDIPDVGALAPLDGERVGIEEGRRPAVTAGHDGKRLLVQGTRTRGLRGVLAQLLLDTHAISPPLTPAPRTASDSRRSRCASATPTAWKRSDWPGLT